MALDRQKAALVGAALGITLWYIFDQPILAIVLTVFIDVCAVVPTLRKSFIDPESETLSTWIIVGTGAILGTIAVGKLDITLLIYPLYLAIANLAVAGAIVLGKTRLKK